MQRHHFVMSMTLSLCLATPGIAAPPPPSAAFDGLYGGAMTEAPAGVSKDRPYAACETSRPASMSITNGQVTMWYQDWHRHTLHYRGQVSADGTVRAYHRNSDGSLSPLVGRISGSQLTADMHRGPCAYTVALTRQ